MGNQKLKIAFRVDAGNVTGTGHLMEIVSLIKSLRKRMDFYAIAIVNGCPLCIERLQSIVEKIEIIPEGVTADKEIDFLISFLKKERIFVLIADLLNKPIVYYNMLCKEVTKTFILLDNGEHIEISATVVVNFSITQSPQFYKNTRLFNTEYLIGPKYALLGESLHDKWAGSITFRKEVKKIFVNQGGGDPHGLTKKILRVLGKMNLSQEVIVVVGGALTQYHRKELEDLKSKLRGNYKFYEDIPQSKMYELLYESDMALTAAGNTLYELAFFGIPPIIISHHAEHDKVADKFREKDAAINLGIGTEIAENDIAEAIKFLLHDTEKRDELSRNGRQIVDGYGTARVADKIVSETVKLSKYVE